MSLITKANLQFLQNLRKNNNRDWFNENKPTYQKHHQEVADFADALIAALNEHDNIETQSGKKSMFRIYRDVRFSKDKTPYNTHWSGGFSRATKLLRGGYYFRITPGGSMIAGGFWGPNSEDMKRIREEIAHNPQELRDIIAAKGFVNAFGQLDGEQVKTAPKGYSKDHPAIDLLRYKQFLVSRSFTDAEVVAPDFLQKANDTYKAMRPFFDYMSEVLTTNANGELLAGL